MYVTPFRTSKSTTVRNTPKKKTVATTTPVVEMTSSRLGQVTCFLSTRTSRRNSRAFPIVPESFSPTPAATPVIALPCDSPFFTLTDCVVILPLLRSRDRHEGVSRESLAGEEGFEPPYPVLETGVLTVGRLPFTPSPRSGRGVYPSALHQPQLLSPAPTLDFLLPPPRCLTVPAALFPNQLDRSPLCGVTGTYAPVVSLDPLCHVVCDSDVERAVFTSHHVAEPRIARLCHKPSRFYRPFVPRCGTQGKPES